MLKGLAQKAKEHIKTNKKEYIIGGSCFLAGSILTHFLARPSIGTVNVYNIRSEKKSAEKPKDFGTF